MNQDEVQVWRMKDSYIVWGTHEASKALAPLQECVANSVAYSGEGFDADEAETLALTPDVEEARRYWGIEGAVDGDELVKGKYASEHVEGWTPFMLIGGLSVVLLGDTTD